MRSIDKKIKDLWDERSKKYQSEMAGVLPKSFPLLANKAIDDWEFNIISGLVDNKDNFVLLDVGCGYGRTSERLFKKNKKIKAIGIDIAKSYVDIYNKKLKPRGKAYVGDMRHLPLKNESVDLVVVVTSLMYIVNKDDQKNAIYEIFRVLKKGGRFVIIERDIAGYKLITLGGIVGKLRGEKNKEITAVGFDPKDIKNLIKKSEGRINQIEGIPVFTILLPLSFILNKIFGKNLMEGYFRLVARLDKIFKSTIYPSIYIAYTGTKI